MFFTASILKLQKWQKNVRKIYSFTDSAVTAIIQLASTRKGNWSNNLCKVSPSVTLCYIVNMVGVFYPRLQIV